MAPQPDAPTHPYAAAADGGNGDAREVARVLAGIRSELLNVEPHPDDDFFLLGGHSLVATRLIAGVREWLGVEMRLRTLFQTRTVADMAR